MSRAWAIVAIGAIGLAAAGCDEPLETGYGRMRGKSINGTGALAALLREEGHTVRAAIRLSDDLADWADVIIRFAPYPGPPDRKEADWYVDWLINDSDRHLVYVPRDYDAEPDYWADVLAHLPAGTEPSRKKRAEERSEHAAQWPDRVPKKSEEPAEPKSWFAVEPAPGPPAHCKALEGTWADGVDARAASLTRHEALRVDQELVLLKGDGATLAMTWNFGDASGDVLVIANGSFLLNAALANPARRPLARRLLDWLGDDPCQVAFVEGEIGEGAPQATSPLAILRVPPFGWIIGHLLAFGLLASLAKAVRLGRPRSEPATDAERPSAHPEAIGGLLERIGDFAAARETLDTYRRWRSPSAQHPRPRAPRS